MLGLQNRALITDIEGGKHGWRVSFIKVNYYFLTGGERQAAQCNLCSSGVDVACPRCFTFLCFEHIRQDLTCAQHQRLQKSKSPIIQWKELGPIAADFSQTFWDFGIRRKLTPGEFCGWKVYPLEDINENVTSYGNHN